MQKIMVVDDDIDVLFGVQTVLRKSNYFVIPLSDCTTAINDALKHEPHLILLDINLGLCDGRQICHQLKVAHQLSIPVLLYSANGEYASSVEEYKSDGFIQKPFTSAEFVEFISNHLQHIS